MLAVQVSQWKAQLLEQLPDAFERGRAKRKREEEDRSAKEAILYQKIGQLEIERDWLKKNLRSLASSPESKRRLVVGKAGKLSLKRRCELLDLPRSTFHYRAIGENGPPSKAFNTDQGCQFTSEAWTTALQQHRITISMDGRGRALDNAFVERLWRSYKYEEVYRREYRDIADARTHARQWFDFYNHRCPHSAIGDVPPARCQAANRPAAA